MGRLESLTYRTIGEDCNMAETPAQTLPSLGFLTIVQENNGYLGGYLVTNSWGRPLEFRLSTAVQPNRIQQILFGGSLQAYICADLIGKTLVDKTAAVAQCIITDCEAVLDLRLCVDLPVVYLAIEGARLRAPIGKGDCRSLLKGTVPFTDLDPAASAEATTAIGKWPMHYHPRFPADVATVRALCDHLDGSFDLAEPFVRIREAMSEARKLGVVNRN
jgi:hypothetical protein